MSSSRVGCVKDYLTLAVHIVSYRFPTIYQIIYDDEDEDNLTRFIFHHIMEIIQIVRALNYHEISHVFRKSAWRLWVL